MIIKIDYIKKILPRDTGVIVEPYVTLIVTSVARWKTRPAKNFDRKYQNL